MLNDIQQHIAIINDALAWAKKNGKEAFPAEQLRRNRRKLVTIARALSTNCSAAAYGESQVGKSYLMSSLLSSAKTHFTIDGGDGRNYDFINDLNPSGGNNNKVESTGVVTRFTLADDKNQPTPAGLVRITTLSVPDIIMMLADSYYNDIKIDNRTSLSSELINDKLSKIVSRWRPGAEKRQDTLRDDDISDIIDYIDQVVGNNASQVIKSQFEKMVAASIHAIAPHDWPEVFSLLWNENPDITALFRTLLDAYQRLEFRPEVFVPFAAVMRDKGSLLQISWLDTLNGGEKPSPDDVPTTSVFRADGSLLCADFGKGEMSALTAELTFHLPQDLTDERPFLRKMDLLDFPGARTREQFKEAETAKVLPKVLRRGKVAYLFNKYSRSMQISSVLFCHHNDQKSGPTVGQTINDWIVASIGETPLERARMLTETQGISPLFFVGTKFNIDLERTRNDVADAPESLDKHWNRFDTILPEIVKPNTWLDQWSQTTEAAPIQPFTGIYPLRDFYYSGKSGLFDGFSDREGQFSPEQREHQQPDYPDYLGQLRKSFVANDFVRRHFADPARAWAEFATLNNDGSRAIIRDLDAISGVLDQARRAKYANELNQIKTDLLKALEIYYEPADNEAKNKKVRRLAGDIRRSLISTIAADPTAFGRVLDRLAVSPEPLRNIVYDILVRHTDAPRDFSAVNVYRATAGIDLNDDRQKNIDRLLDYCMLDTVDELEAHFKAEGIELADIIDRKNHTLSSMGDVVVMHLVEYWREFLNNAAVAIQKTLPHADEVVFMLISLFDKLDVRARMVERVNRYLELFAESEQPNAIADYAALTFNNFVSSVGRQYMSDDLINDLRPKAELCHLPVDFSPAGWNRTRSRQPLLDTLRVFDQAPDLVNQNHIDINVLRQLPLWANYQRWENFVIIGLVCASDISHCDPVLNAQVKDMIDRTSGLYAN